MGIFTDGDCGEFQFEKSMFKLAEENIKRGLIFVYSMSNYSENGGFQYSVLNIRVKDLTNGLYFNKSFSLTGNLHMIYNEVKDTVEKIEYTKEMMKYQLLFSIGHTNTAKEERADLFDSKYYQIETENNNGKPEDKYPSPEKILHRKFELENGKSLEIAYVYYKEKLYYQFKKKEQ